MILWNRPTKWALEVNPARAGMIHGGVDQEADGGG